MSTMKDTADYDAPRRPVADLDEDAVVQPKTRRAVTDLDEPETSDLPAAEPIDEEPIVAVVPMLADEFRCSRCYLVHHRSRLVHRADGSSVCPDCS
jgi:hypothetical protein